MKVLWVDAGLHRVLEDVGDLGIGRMRGEEVGMVGMAEPWRALVY